MIVNDSKCPFCDKKLNRATNSDGDIPQAGDISVCIKCAEIIIFDDDQQLRKPTEQESEEFTNDSELKKLIYGVQRMRAQYILNTGGK